MDKIIEQLRAELNKISDEKTRISSQNFFKEEVKFYGVTNPKVTKIAKDLYLEINKKSKAEIFEICETLWQSGYMEEALVACEWSYRVRKNYEPSDFMVFERWIDNYVTNWATCDTLCNHTVGDFVVMYPEFLERLKTMAKSPNRWMRRAAAVSLIVPARKGKFLDSIFQISDILLTDADDLVRKGYGWMLKEASRVHQQDVFEFVMKHKAVMPRTSLRYAIEKMPADLKKMAMEK